MITETKRRASNRERLLALLGDRREHNPEEMQSAGGYRYGARLKELRDQGYVIETDANLTTGEVTYRLLAAPGERRPTTDQRGQCLLLEVTSC
jgi:hypothetical protein